MYYMQLEIGQIVQGKVTKITTFGVFVEIEPQVSGLVHISEISKLFVANINDFLSIGDIVKVKVLNNSSGKLNLSIKQAQELAPKRKSNLNYDNDFSAKKESAQQNKQKKLNFEEMLSKFKRTSEENLSMIKRNFHDKRNSYSRKR